MTLVIAYLFHGAWGVWDEIIPIVVAVLFTAAIIFAVWYSRRLKADVEKPETESEQEIPS